MSLYEPFEQAIDQYKETEHVQPLEIFQERLQEGCWGCVFRKEMACTACQGCGRRSLIRWAERLKTKCPRGVWRRLGNG